MLYYALVQSHLTYGNLGSGRLVNAYSNKIGTTQRWILKIMFGKPFRYSSDLLYSESGIYDLRQLYYQPLMINHHSQLHEQEEIKYELNTRYKKHFTVLPKIKYS